MELYEKKISEQKVYEGKIFDVYSDKVELPNKQTSTRDWVKHNGGAAILVLDQDKNVYLVEQYRYSVGRVVLEIPAGKIDKGENPYNSALRELEEELGFKAEKIEPLGVILPTVGYVSERIHLYLATEYELSKQHLDEGEFVNVVKMPLATLIDKIENFEIEDAKTVIAVTRYILKYGDKNFKIQAK